MRTNRGKLLQIVAYVEAIGFILAFCYGYLAVEPEALQGLWVSDKALHAVGSAGLMTILLLGLVSFPRSLGSRNHGLPIVIALGIALLASFLEAAQRVADRSVDPLDALANIAGIATALWVWSAFTRRAGTRDTASVRENEWSRRDLVRPKPKDAVA